MKDKLSTMLFCLLFLATAFGLALLSPKAERNKTTDAYAEFVQSIKHKPRVVYRDGDWVEIELPSGELSFEDDPRHLYGEPDAKR